MTGLTQDDLAILKRRFELEEHEFHRGNVYLRERAICDRIELVDPSWTNDIIQMQPRTTADGKLMIVVLMRVTVNGVFRDGIGQSDVVLTKAGGEANEPEKSAATDALKRAVRLFGVGRYLLDTPKEVENMQGLKAWFDGEPINGSKSNVPTSQGTTPSQYRKNASTGATASNNGTLWFQDAVQQDKVKAAIGYMPGAGAAKIHKTPADFENADALIAAYREGKSF